MDTRTTLEFAEQVEQEQDRLERRFRGEELFQAEPVSTQVVLEFGDAIFHVGTPVVVAPDLFGRITATGDDEAKGITGQLEQFAAYAATAFANQFAHDHEALWIYRRIQRW